MAKVEVFLAAPEIFVKRSKGWTDEGKRAQVELVAAKARNGVAEQVGACEKERKKKQSTTDAERSSNSSQRDRAMSNVLATTFVDEPLADEVVLTFSLPCKVHMGDDSRVLKGELIEAVQVEFDAVTLVMNGTPRFIGETDDDFVPSN